MDLDRALDAQARRDGVVAYLELHIEQGPVLESEGVSAAAVSGTAGVERHRFTFEGRTSHAGTTPMHLREDAGLAAARTALAVELIAEEHGGVGTTGVMRLEPGIPTAVPGSAEIVVDLRHARAEPLQAMLEETREVAGQYGAPVFRIEPIPFGERLIAAAGLDRVIPSGALHDAAEMAPPPPTAMVFAPSSGGLSPPRPRTPRRRIWRRRSRRSAGSRRR